MAGQAMQQSGAGSMGEKKLGVGVIGIGWVAGEHIKSYKQNPNSEVVALASSSRENAQAAAQRHGLPGARQTLLPGDLGADSALDAAEGVHVLELGLDPELRLP